jgi:glutathione S-transferase
MKLYGNNVSFNSNKVRFAANAMGLKYEFQSVDLAAGEQRTPEFLKVNPTGRIPCLQDGSFVVFESNTIMRYLAEKNNSPLYPKELERRTLVNQWLDFGSIHLGGAMSKIFYNTLIYKVVGGTLDERSLTEGRQFLANHLKLIEGQLAKTPYVCGSEMTLADLNILAILDPSEVTASDISAFGKVVAWRKKLQGQEFYKQVFGASYTEFLNGLFQKA